MAPVTKQNETKQNDFVTGIFTIASKLFMGNLRKLSHLTALCIVLSRSSMAQCFGTTSTSTNTLFVFFFRGRPTVFVSSENASHHHEGGPGPAQPVPVNGAHLVGDKQRRAVAEALKSGHP